MQESQLAIILLLLVPVPISIYLLVYIARRRAPVDLPLGLIVITGGIWSCGYAMELYFDSFEAKVLAERFEYLGLVIGPTGWLLLGVYFQGKLGSISRAGYLLLSAVPIATLILVFTSDSHAFFWQGKTLVEFSGFTLFSNEYGFGFWLHAVYSYTIQLVGAGLIFKTMFDSDAYYFRQKLMVSFAVMLPWFTSIVYVFRIIDYPIDFSPFALVLSSIVLVLVVFRLKLGELIPIARERVMSEMRDAILVIDDTLRIVDFNHAFVELCGSHSVRVGQKADELLEAHPRLTSFLDKQEKSEDLVYTGFGTSVHRVSSEMIETGRDAHAKLVIFRNLSGESRVQEALRLVVEGTSGDLGEEYYRSLVRSLALALNVKYAVLAIRDGTERELFTTVAFWAGTGYRENLTYQFKGAPSERVIEEGTSVFPHSVAQLFPADMTLIKYNIESYIGTPLYGYDGIPLGVLAVMDESPLDSGAEGSALLEFFAMRAAAEVERRRSERNIRASEESYRRIVETTKDGVCVVNRDGVVEFVNLPMANLIGEEPDSLVGRTLMALFPDEETLPETLVSQDDAEFEFSFLNFDDVLKSVSLSKAAIKNSADEVTGMLYMFSDISEKVLLEQTNKGIEAQLRHAQKLESLGVLAGGVAHDFNNLLMPILGYIDLLKERSVDDSVITDYLSRMELAGSKLADLCNQMLTYSGKGHVVETVLDINVQVLEMQELARASIPRNLTINYAIKDGLPEIRADGTQLNQVMMNLLINASESMSHKSAGTITITTGESFLDASPRDSLHIGDELKVGNYVYFEVMDEGVGISEEDQLRLFEPFFTTKFTGRGLGMAVVFGIIRAHHGAIEIRSILGKGTTIRAYFPPTVNSLQAEGMPTDESKTKDPDTRGQVLVVDDEPYVRDLMRSMLKSMGYQSLEAEDGKQGFSMFRSHRDEIEFCILDLTMPGMGGVELLGLIRGLPSEVPVILVSGYSQQEIRQRDLEASNVVFLQKPFSLSQFQSAVQEQLSHRVLT